MIAFSLPILKNVVPNTPIIRCTGTYAYMCDILRYLKLSVVERGCMALLCKNTNAYFLAPSIQDGKTLSSSNDGLHLPVFWSHANKWAPLGRNPLVHFKSQSFKSPAMVQSATPFSGSLNSQNESVKYEWKVDLHFCIKIVLAIFSLTLLFSVFQLDTFLVNISILRRTIEQHPWNWCISDVTIVLIILFNLILTISSDVWYWKAFITL